MSAHPPPPPPPPPSPPNCDPEPLLTNLQMIVFGNVGGLLNLIVFVFLLTFLASIFASQLFRGEIPETDDGETVRVPFNDIWNSFIGMYVIFSSENWTEIMYTVTGYQKAFGTAWIGASFCILWFIFANRKYIDDFHQLG